MLAPRHLWLAYLIGAAAAGIFSAYAWALNWYIQGLYGFLALTIGLATSVLIASRRTAVVLGIIVACFLAANSVALKMLLTAAIWHFNGFAP